MRMAQAAGRGGRPPMGNPEVPAAQGPYRGAFAGGPGVETAVRTTGLQIAGRNPGESTDLSWLPITAPGSALGSGTKRWPGLV